MAPPCMVWTLRTMSLTSDPGSYQINCCPYVSITWLLTNRRRVTSVALSPLNWTDVFVVCACLLRWERVNGLLNMVPEPGRHGELWEVGEDGETLAALPVVGFGPVLGCAHVWTGGWACHWCCRFRRHVLPWGSLGWKRVAVLGCGEAHHRSVNAYWSARGFPIIGTFVWGRSYQWSWRRTWFLLLVMGAADGRGTSASTWVWQLRIPEALGFVDPLGSVGFVCCDLGL